MRVMITGGGTGGHTSPAVAIIEELRRRDPQLMLRWAGRHGGIEERVAAANHVPFRNIPVAGWPRKRSIRRLWVAAKLVLGILRGSIQLLRFRPQVVIGVGGYVSLPLMFAAQRLGIPTVLHEQNKRLGMANRILAPRAHRVFLSYENTIGEFPETTAMVVGNPVRTGFIMPPESEEAKEALGLDPKIPVLLVSGGSQGAQSINQAIAGALSIFETNEIQVIWMTGSADFESAQEAAKSSQVPVQVHPFIDDMPTACAAADILVGRAGASSTAEIAVLGKPSILIPYPHATDNHQEKNARAFEEAGAAEILLDTICEADTLVKEIRGILRNPKRLESMRQAAKALARPHAAETMVEEIMQTLFVDEEANAETE